MPSRFLPPNFDISKPLCIIAGRGEYPVMLADSARKAGADVRLIGFVDETFEDFFNSFRPEDRVMLKVGQIGKILSSLKKFEAGYAVMAGQIAPKKLFSGMLPDFKAITMLAKLREVNAETIFGAIADEITLMGVELLDARCFMDSQMMPAGFLFGKSWGIKDEHLAHGLRIARECAALDIGQGCVVSRGTVIAVEAYEGTDRMLERAGTFHAKDMLFVKTVKRNQDYRFDVPIIGTRTIRKLAEANVRNAALEAGQVIVLEIDKVRAEAEKNGIAIYGVPEE